MTIEYIKNWFEILSYAATIIGIPLAIIVYLIDKKLDRKLREKEALIATDAMYVDFLKICLENPELEIYDLSYKNSLFSLDSKKELISFEILIAYLESVFHQYKDHSDRVKRKSWEAWVSFIKGYIKQENFMKAWRMTDPQWDEDFRNFMNDMIKIELKNT